LFAPGLLSGRRALITGGGTGLGRAIARRYLQLGARIAICGRRLAVLEETAAALRAEIPGADIAVYACDIRDAAAVEAMTATRQPLLAGRSSPAATALAGLWADVERRLTA
jgi:NAD(P)-dependent dehydrogenase (short-subunit alcohol dehydrogenase family)